MHIDVWDLFAEETRRQMFWTDDATKCFDVAGFAFGVWFRREICGVDYPAALESDLGKDLNVVGDGAHNGRQQRVWSHYIAQAPPGAHPPTPKGIL